MSKIFFIIFYLFFINLYSAEFSNGKIEKKSYSVDRYYDSLGIGNIKLIINECDKKKENCDTNIMDISFKDGVKSVKKVFNFDFGITTIIAKGRYDDHKAVVLKQTVIIEDPDTKDKKKINRFWLITDKSGKLIKTKTINPASKILRKDDTPLILANFGARDFKVAEISYATEPTGKVSVVVLDKENLLWVSNGDKWISINDYLLAEHGDRHDILSVYPDTISNKVFVAVYKYVNPFNKGLDLIVVDFDKANTFYTSLYNSDEYNFGWSPRIYSTKDDLLVTAIDSSNDRKKTVVNKKSNLENIKYSVSPYIEGFENESYFSFMTAASIMKNYWYMSASVNNPKTGNDIANTNYDIASTLSWSTSVQGRIGDTQIGVSYMQSKMNDQEGLKGDISQFLSMTVDFNSLFSKQITLRLVTEFSNLKGFANSKYGKNEIGSNINKIATDSVDTKYWKGELLLMWERGLYSGLSYAKYTMPGVVGLTDKSKNIVYTDYDEKLGLHDIEILFGYDVSSYAKRYEVNYNKFYLGGAFGIGMGFFNLSDGLLDRLEDAAGTKTIIHKYAVSFSAELELGFIFQRRFRELGGMGYSIVAGYRVESNFINSSQSSEDEDEDGNDTTIDGDELYFEHERIFLKHGPFILFNWIF